MPSNLGLPTPSGEKSKTKYVPPDYSRKDQHRQHGSRSRRHSESGAARGGDSRAVIPRSGGGAPNEADMSLARPAPNMGRGEVGRIGPNGRGGQGRDVQIGGGPPAIMGVRPLPVGVLVPPPFEERGRGYPDMGGPMMGRRDNSDTARQLAELAHLRHERELRDIQEDMDDQEDYEHWVRLQQQRRQQQQEQLFLERPDPGFYRRGTPGNVPVMPVMGVVPVAPVPGMVRRPLPYGAGRPGSRPMDPRDMYDSD